ncbi:MAG TPA: tetratricopeptide repeat protein [Candidatus Polarisedimenticolia bacterium]|nr:tetratricopeptide repeat protein [Candidatus Polarisedimenticolia bacterium]
MALNRAKVLETADKLVRQGKLEDAIRHYMVLSEDNPRDVNTINRIGDLYVRLRKNKEGIRQFMRIADFYAGDGFHLKAIAMYKKITKLEPTHVDANERLADMYAKQGLSTEAKTQFLALAEQCIKAGQKSKALEIYEKIHALEPENAKIQLIIAEIHARDEEPDKAFDGYMAVVAQLKKRGLPEEGLKVLQKASRLKPGHPEVLAQMAELLQAGGKQPQEALGILESLHQGDPANPRYLQMLAEAYLRADRIDAFQKLSSSVAGGELRVTLLETEARALVLRYEPEKAAQKLKAAAEESLKENGAEAAAALLEQALKLASGKHDFLSRLLEVWTQAANRDGMVSALERLAQEEVQTKQWERAIHFLDRLQNLAPESALASEMRKEVENNAPAGIGRPSAAKQEESSVPSLDELERVVELDTSELPGSGDEDALEIDFEEPSEEIRPLEGREEISGPLERANEDEAIREQEQAYSGKSVIQEMRGDPEKPEMDEDFLNEHFTEAEVFLKYGLIEKAREQLQAILDRYPQHMPSLAKMKEVHVEEGRKSEAAGLCLRLAALHREKGEDEKASEWEEQAKELDPGAKAQSAAARSSGPPLASMLEHLEIAGAPPAAGDLDLDLSEELSGEPRPSAGDRPMPPPLLADDPEEELTIELVDEAESAQSEDARIADRIHQLEFSLQQGLHEEAEQIFRDLEGLAPSHPELRKLKEKLTAPPPVSVTSLPVTGGDLDMDVEMAFGSAPTPESTEKDSAPSRPVEDGFFDLAAELKAHAVDSTPDASSDPLAGLSTKGEATIDEIFKAFRKKVEQQVEEEDYETRYNLGIAYKEMGLLDEAIGEFQNASRDPNLFLESCSILGICFREKGMLDLAVKWYRKALESTGHPEEKYQGLRYDLGDLHLERGDYAQALSLFSEVYGINSNYRDVASKVRELRKRVG